ncbi:hypothetical protein BDV95DRAFT_591141 [Massariosphaeria phaeospora]|uniref:Uncharacterized protein n=1 Tax=Massariosphaeria phaeospora TaxID=100035 RepID=A0A7C8IBW4_9PLEO|nr:hypothetical protein BDV95DRAFT_591141 [Massariosphaeria phaeospora]
MVHPVPYIILFLNQHEKLPTQTLPITTMEKKPRIPVTDFALPANTPWASLPEEIRFQILEYVLTFPHGIHSECWPWTRKTRVAPLLTIPSMAHLVPEALHSNNSLTIRLTFKPQTPKDGKGATYKTQLDYPLGTNNKWVKDLEFHALPDHFMFDNGDHNSFPMQYSWLQKLANGELGFSQLESLRIVIKPRHYCPDVGEDILLRQFFLDLKEAQKDTGPLRFRVKTLEVETLEQTLTGNGTYFVHEPPASEVGSS